MTESHRVPPRPGRSAEPMRSSESRVPSYRDAVTDAVRGPQDNPNDQTRRDAVEGALIGSGSSPCPCRETLRATSVAQREAVLPPPSREQRVISRAIGAGQSVGDGTCGPPPDTVRASDLGPDDDYSGDRLLDGPERTMFGEDIL